MTAPLFCVDDLHVNAITEGTLTTTAAVLDGLDPSGHARVRDDHPERTGLDSFSTEAAR